MIESRTETKRENVTTDEAIEKIKAILREHDLWAAFIIVSEEEVGRASGRGDVDRAAQEFLGVDGVARIPAARPAHPLAQFRDFRVHWLYHFDPSWSCLHFNPTTGEARIKAKRADFASEEQHRRVLELTTGAITSTRDFAAKQFSDASKLFGMLEAQFEIEYEYSDPRDK